MALLKAFVCQVVLFGLYKLFLEQVVVDHLVPEELTRNCLVGLVILLCFGIQLYTEKVEEQAEAAKAKSRRRTPPDTAESVSEFLDERTAHMMRTLDAAMRQMPVSDGYVQNVIFATSGPDAAVIEQTFSKQTDGVVIEEIYATKLNDVIYSNEKSEVSASEPIVVPQRVEEVRAEKENDKTESDEEEEEVEEDEEEEVEEEAETKSDVCEEEEEDVVTVIDTSKPKPKPEVATKDEDEEEEEEEEEDEDEAEEKVSSSNKENTKSEMKPALKQSEVEEEEEEEEESEEEEVEEKKTTRSVTKTS